MDYLCLVFIGYLFLSLGPPFLLLYYFIPHFVMLYLYSYSLFVATIALIWPIFYCFWPLSLSPPSSLSLCLLMG